MAEVDTSSYPKPQPGKGLLDQVQQYQTIESNKISIEKQKLDQINQGYGYLIRELNSLPENATAKDMMRVGQQAVKMKLIQPDMYATFASGIPQDPAKIKSYRDEVAGKLLSTQEAINFQYGNPQLVNQGAALEPTNISQRRNAITPAAGQPIPLQLPPTSQEIGPDNRTTFRGVAPSFNPDGSTRAPMPQLRPRLPVANPEGPITDPAIKGPSANFGGNVLGATVENLPPANFNQRFAPAMRPVTAREPGAAEAEVATGAQSGQALAQARTRASSFSQDMFPVKEALNAVKTLGTKGTGPGTDTINQVKSFILSNIPGVAETDPGLASVTDFDKAKKYLVQIARSTGNSATNDQLAAAFSGNPNVGISNAATQDVLGSIYALRALDLAKTKAWEKQNLPDAQFTKFSSTWDNNIDPRAFGVQYMRPEAIIKLNKSLKGKDREKFNNSVQIARELGL